MSQSTQREWEDYTGIDQLTDSDRHRLLAAKRRRLVLDVLERRTVPLELRDIAERVAARENNNDATESETVERMATSLHHVHLPMMTDVGVIDYDPGMNRVESGPEYLSR